MDIPIDRIESRVGIFSPLLIDSVVKLLSIGIRKKRWGTEGVGSGWPPALSQMKEELLTKFPYLRINTAILKRYSLNENSGGYILHRDPDEFMQAPLVLITLQGKATLSVEVESKLYPITCEDGHVIILKDPFIKHVVSPPTNASGVRYFLFFGYDNVVISS